MPAVRMDCICLNSQFILNNTSEQVLQCVSPTCQRTEHLRCVFPNNVLSWPIEQHHCMKCRMAFADPFWHSVSGQPEIIPPTTIQPIRHPRKAIPRAINGEIFCAIEQLFYLSTADITEIRSRRQKIQVLCMQLSDEVQFRYHWPKHCSLRVNNQQYRVYSRHGETPLAKGQRDEPFVIDAVVQAGTNKIHLNCYETRSFVLCVQMVKQTSMDTIFSMIHSPESLEMAVKRVKHIVKSQVHCVVDEEVKATTSVMSLKCPFSSTRISTPGRLLNVDALECVFDLNAFLTMVEKTRKWACPHTLRSSSIHHLAKDVWLEAILRQLSGFPEIDEIEVNVEAKWRIRGEHRWRTVYHSTPINRLPPSLNALKKEAAELDEESDDEVMELRKAAQAAKQELQQHHRTHPPAVIEVIDLLSSGDEETQTTEIQAHAINTIEDTSSQDFRSITDGLARNIDHQIVTLRDNGRGELQVDLAGQYQDYQFPVMSHQPFASTEYTQVNPVFISSALPVHCIPHGLNNVEFSQSNELEQTQFPQVLHFQRKRNLEFGNVQTRHNWKKARNFDGAITRRQPDMECVELDQTDSN